MSIWQKLLFALVVIVGLLATVWGVLVALASGARSEAEKVWTEIGDREEIVTRYGRLETENELATQLEEVTERFDLSVEPRGSSNASNELEGVRQVLGTWLDSQYELSAESAEPLPGELEAFMEKHQRDIDEAASILVSGVPEWPRESERLSFEQPIPNLLGHMSMIRLNAAASLRADAAGDDERAWRYQQASWSLVQGLSRRPELISKLIAIASVRIMSVVARRLEPPVPDWFDDFAALDLRKQVIDGMYFEHLVMSRALDAEDAHLVEFGAPEAFDGAVLFVVKPYFEWALGHSSRVWGGALKKAIDADPCVPVQTIDQAAIDTIPRIAQPIGLIAMPNLLNAYTRASNGELYVENAEVLLRLKEARMAEGGWPPALESDGSTLCSGGRWVYATDGTGMTLEFDGPIPVPLNYPGALAPMRWEEP